MRTRVAVALLVTFGWAATSTPGAASEGSAVAPDFELTDSYGAGIRLSEFRGRAVALLFWARWCTSCEEDLRVFEELRQRYEEKDLVILGLGYASGSRTEIGRFAADLGVTFPMLLCTEAVRDAYQVAVYPTTMLVDRDGRVQNRRTGALVGEYWQHTLDALLAGE